MPIYLKRKSTLVVLLMMLWSLVAGCVAYQTYEELDDEARQTGDTTKVDKREARYEKAVLFLENKQRCLASRDAIWFCARSSASRIKRRTESVISVDGVISEHRRDWEDGCGCVSNSDIFR